MDYTDRYCILTSAFVTVSATPPFSVVVCPFVKLSVTSFGVIGFPPVKIKNEIIYDNLVSRT